MRHRMRSIVLTALVLLVGGSPVAAQNAPHATPMPAGPEMDLSSYQGPKGKLAIRAVQGTKGGPAVGGDEAELVLFHRNAAIKRYPLKLDESGLAMVTDLPVGLGIRPVVRIRHAGVYYQQLGEPLDIANPVASMEVVVFEVTPTVPAWKVVLRQLMFERKESSVLIAETVVVDNPTDSSWLGGDADTQGRRTTVSLAIPSGASDIQLEKGFHGWCCTEFKDSNLNIQMPLMPGRTTFQFAYALPSPDGRIDLTVTTRAPVEHAAVYVPSGETVSQADRLRPAGVEMIEGSANRLYQADGLKSGDSFRIVIAAAVAAAPATPSSQLPWYVIAGAVVCAAGAVVALKAIRQKRQPQW